MPRLADRAMVLGCLLVAACASARSSDGLPPDGAAAPDPAADTAIVDGESHDTGAIQVAAGQFQTCALTAQRSVMCWGRNDHGQLGDGTTTSSLVPVAVTGIEGPIVQLAVGAEHACALTSAGAVLCWGNNLEGELGNATTQESHLPVPVVGLSSGVTAISAKGTTYTTCAVAAGGVQCWGNNSDGQLGNNSTGAYSAVPVPVTGLTSGVAEVSVAFDHACARTTSGAAWCWGYNDWGELGAGTQVTLSRVPLAVVGLSSGVAAIVTGTLHSCALTTAGAALCWGRNSAGAIGNGTTEDSWVPMQVSGLSSGVDALYAADGAVFAIKAGAALRWGVDLQHWAGWFDHFSSVPVPFVGLPAGIPVFAPGSGYACAMTTGGAVHCWGYNDSGQLGNNTTQVALTPQPVVGFP